jgi:multidrug efflux system membrane fusion protein
MKSSYVIALLLALVAGGWILSGQLGEPGPPARAGDQQVVIITIEDALPQVQVREQVAELLTREIVVTGQTRASRHVTLRAETAGPVEDVPVSRGSQVEEGQVVARIALDDRGARLAEVMAQQAQRQLEYDATLKLAEKNFRAETSVAEARALLDAARAAVMIMEVNISKTTIEAPFAGVLEERPIEVGDFLEVGDKVGMVVDLDPCLVVAQVSEREVDKLRLGGPGTATLVNGVVIEGHISYISAVAEPATRTFTVELEVANTEGRIMEGLTSQVRLPVGTVNAHFVSRSLLTLADDGMVGVKAVDDKGIVGFHAVRIVDDGADGVWLTGPPQKFTLITVGQEFVHPGMRVEQLPTLTPAHAGN